MRENRRTCATTEQYRSLSDAGGRENFVAGAAQRVENMPFEVSACGQLESVLHDAPWRRDKRVRGACHEPDFAGAAAVSPAWFFHFS